jgi:competence protein ComEA
MRSTGERSRGQVVAYVAAAVLVAVAAFRYVGGGEEAPAEPVEIDAGSSEEASAGEPGSGSGEVKLYVHVAGAVRREGLYSVPAGTRVGAAIDRAGGTTPAAELAGVNLAAELQDGQQVVVPKRGEVPPAAAATTGTAAPTSGAASGADGAPAAPISLAQATPEELDASIDGIGPVLAGAIIEYRDEKGSVGSIDELAEVDGIGEERLATLREALVP